MVAVSYYPALWAGFVWDDWIFIGEPTVHDWSGLWNIWFSPADIELETHYWPITYTTFWLEHKLWGVAPFGYHLVNVLLHMANVLLLWYLLRRLAVPGAWAVAAVFAVHPMHVESVAWIIGRKDLLSGLFCVASALCWIRFMESSRRLESHAATAQGARRLSSLLRRWWPDDVQVAGCCLAALGLFAAAMLSKSVAVTLPATFAIFLWWNHGRVTWADGLRIAPFFLIALCIAVVDLTYYTSRQQVDLGYGLPERMLIAAHSLWFYVGKLVWPTDLAVVYPLWNIDGGDPLAWGYLIAAVAVVAVFWFRRHSLGRGPLAGAVFFAVTLSPTLGFVDFGYMRYSFVADRYAYLAGIGVIAVVVGVAVHGAVKLPNLLKAGAAVVLVALLATFGRLTWEQAGVYRDDITFYNHIISFNPEAPFVHRNLAKALIDAERLEEAVAVSLVAVRRSPGSAVVHNTHGAALFALNRLDEAGQSFQRALELDSNHTHARYNLAQIRRRQGRFVESIRGYRGVLDIDPEYVLAREEMGHALFALGQYKEAVESLRQAVSLRPDAVPNSVFHNLAEALRRLQRYEEAVEAYRSVLASDPESASAHAGMGYALFQLNRNEEAIESLGRSVSLQPESPANADRHVAMGRACVELGRTEVAAEHFARALEIDPRNTKALDSYAVLRFRQQRYEEALSLYEAFIEVGEANAQVHVNMGRILYNLGRREEALRSLDRALALDPALAGTGLEEMRDALRRELQ